MIKEYGKKKGCIKRKIHNSIFRILIFENFITLLSCGVMFEICWVTMGLTDITKDDENNDRCLKKKPQKKPLRKGRKNECEHFVHENKFGGFISLSAYIYIYIYIYDKFIQLLLQRKHQCHQQSLHQMMFLDPRHCFRTEAL